MKIMKPIRRNNRFLNITFCIFIIVSIQLMLNHEATSSFIKSTLSNEKDGSSLTKEQLVLFNDRLSQELKSQTVNLAELRDQLQQNLIDLRNENDICMKEFTKLRQKKLEDAKYDVHINKFSTKSFIKNVYTFEALDKNYDPTSNGLVFSTDSPYQQADPLRNEMVFLSIVGEEFAQNRTFSDLLTILDQFEYQRDKVSLSLLISDVKMFEEIDNYFEDRFNQINRNTLDLNELQKTFNKVTLIRAPFLENMLNIEKGDEIAFQKVRGKAFARLRNFLVTNGIDTEPYSVFIDSDVTGIDKESLKIFIESNVDIATTRVAQTNKQGDIIHHDYDLKAWSGDRRKPTEEDHSKLDSDPNFTFGSGNGENSIHFSNLIDNLNKFGLTNEKNSKYELKSVGGAILFAKNEIYKQGVMFPPYYSIGTTWDRSEGWDGIETEGLCYQANTIGYKCWGFPNIVTYHSD